MKDQERRPSKKNSMKENKKHPYKRKKEQEATQKVITGIAYFYSAFAAITFIIALHSQPVWFVSKVFWSFLFICYVYTHYKTFKDRKQ